MHANKPFFVPDEDLVYVKNEFELQGRGNKQIQVANATRNVSQYVQLNSV